MNTGPNIKQNSEALRAFLNAASYWESQLADDITVMIDVELAEIASNSIGRTGLEGIERPFDLVRDAMVRDALDEPDDGIVTFLPTAEQIQVDLPPGIEPIDEMILTTANAKALGIEVDDPSLPDSTITFNSRFDFDYDNRDGVDSGHLDFETTAIHELAHVLGFVSHLGFVEVVMDENLDEPIQTSTLDLFRFEENTVNDPIGPDEFRTAPRLLRPGKDAILDFLVHGQFPVSTGVKHGDGRQGDHWKDDSFTGSLIGLMDPTMMKGEVFRPAAPDLRALDLIGWDIAMDAGPALQAGDADQDMDFDQLDLVRVQIAAKYLTNEPATWGDGDWNGASGGRQGLPAGGDGEFDQNDIVAALQSDVYLTGTYSALAANGVMDDERTSVIYNAHTGQIVLEGPPSVCIDSFILRSASEILTRPSPRHVLDGGFDFHSADAIFRGFQEGSCDQRVDLVPVAQTGLSEQMLLRDLTLDGSGIQEPDLMYVPLPEPSALGLLIASLAPVIFHRWKRFYPFLTICTNAYRV